MILDQNTSGAITPGSRVRREAKTVAEMIALYCQLEHKSEIELCAGCAALLEYSHRRLERCPFQAGKTTCAKCPIHCYKPTMRQQIRRVMRFSGPRMLISHPYLALHHLLDGLRKKPLSSSRGQRASESQLERL
jgi:hypothetical protein